MFHNVSTVDQARALVGKPQDLANIAYGNRNGNGDQASGDGWRYRGRGCIQLTGRNNYTAAALKCSEPYLDQPDLVATPGDACLTAGWFWDRNSLNRLADAGDIDGITRGVNGSAMAGAQERRQLFRRFVSLFTASPTA
jgi:putative chitinase